MFDNFFRQKFYLTTSKDKRMSSLQNFLSYDEKMDLDRPDNATMTGYKDVISTWILNPFFILLAKLFIFLVVRVWAQFRREQQRREDLQELLAIQRPIENPAPPLRAIDRPNRASSPLSRDARFVQGNIVLRNRTRRH